MKRYTRITDVSAAILSKWLKVLNWDLTFNSLDSHIKPSYHHPDTRGATAATQDSASAAAPTSGPGPLASTCSLSFNIQRKKRIETQQNLLQQQQQDATTSETDEQGSPQNPATKTIGLPTPHSSCSRTEDARSIPATDPPTRSTSDFGKLQSQPTWCVPMNTLTQF